LSIQQYHIYIGVLYCGYALGAFFLSLSLFITIYITIGTYYLYNNTYICIYPVSLIVAYTYTLHMYTRMRVKHLYCVTIHTSQLIRPELIKNILKLNIGIKAKNVIMNYEIVISVI